MHEMYGYDIVSFLKDVQQAGGLSIGDDEYPKTDVSVLVKVALDSGFIKMHPEAQRVDLTAAGAVVIQKADGALPAAVGQDARMQKGEGWSENVRIVIAMILVGIMCWAILQSFPVR